MSNCKADNPGDYGIWKPKDWFETTFFEKEYRFKDNNVPGFLASF